MSESSQVCQSLSNVLGLGGGVSLDVPMLAASLVLGIIFVISLLFLKRLQTKRRLENCGLPTVHWRPKFINYRPFEEEQKLASSTITRILPRMERLKGPYGMYGTVYGVSTAVIHVAHPVPVRAIFGNGVSARTSIPNNRKRSRRSSIVDSSGASKAPAYDHFKNFCGEGVFTADGEDWKAKRAAVMHCLIKGTNSSTSDISQRLAREANRAADDFCTQVQSLQNHRKMIPNTNIVPLLQRSTVGLIYRYITHDEPDWGFAQQDSKPCMEEDVSVGTTSLSSDDEEGTELLNDDDRTKASVRTDSPATGLLDSYLNSIIRIRMIILAQSRSIWFLLPRWCYRFFSSLYRDEEETVNPIRQFARNACESAKPESPLAKLKEMGSHNGHGHINGIPKDLLDEAITLLFAGQDTSAATLSWTLHLLSLYPDVQSKLADEVQSAMQQDNMPGKNNFVTRKMISKMPYMDAVIKESMRLYPVAPFVVRRIMQDLSILEENEDAPTGRATVLPAGSIACVWIYGLHHNPLLWDRPDDFVPERWTDPDLKDIGQINGAYMPFASGPRNCVGQPLAHVVLRTLLARLLHCYEFRDERLTNGQDPEEFRKGMQAGFTVLPCGGVTLSIRERPI